MSTLFNVKKNYWVLVAESGIGSNYCASKLGEVQGGDTFKIAFPNPMENNGNAPWIRLFRCQSILRSAR